MSDQNLGLSMHVGDTKVLRVAVLDENNDPKVLTGATVRWALSKTGMRVGPSGSPLLEKSTVEGNGGIDIVQPLDGVFEVYLSSDDTKEFTPGRYYHEAEVTDLEGDTVTVVSGNIELKPALIL